MSARKPVFLSLGIALSALPAFRSSPRMHPETKNLPPKEDSIPDDSLLLHLFEDEAVFNSDFVRPVLYTWTTREQIEELRQHKQLLTRSKSIHGEWSNFDKSLRDTSFSKFDIARMLQDNLFANKRFAWSNPWATAMGWKREKYGDQLLKIELDERAIFGIFDANDNTHPFRFYDRKGKKVDEKTVLLHKELLAVMYHVGEQPVQRSQRCKRHGTYGGFEKRKNIPFREFVILNESMIKSWSYGTPEILALLQKEQDKLQKASLLLARAHHTDRYHDENDAEFQLFQKRDDYDPDWFYPATCFENDYYLKNTRCLNRIIHKLAQVKKAQGSAFSK
ncbi:MAG TPA: hypothetical protein VNZ86_12150 [Bacteroidia bacterium]|jgi:hypothetical protein|nr:hypothetical protein [Bacteroidia bacterium]